MPSAPAITITRPDQVDKDLPALLRERDRESERTSALIRRANAPETSYHEKSRLGADVLEAKPKVEALAAEYKTRRQEAAREAGEALLADPGYRAACLAAVTEWASTHAALLTLHLANREALHAGVNLRPASLLPPSAAQELSEWCSWIERLVRAGVLDAAALSPAIAKLAEVTE
jgi:hypothetical protein